MLLPIIVNEDKPKWKSSLSKWRLMILLVDFQVCLQVFHGLDLGIVQQPSFSHENIALLHFKTKYQYDYYHHVLWNMLHPASLHTAYHSNQFYTFIFLLFRCVHICCFHSLGHGGYSEGSLSCEAGLVDIKLHLDSTQLVPLLLALQTCCECTTHRMAQTLTLR